LILLLLIALVVSLLLREMMLAIVSSGLLLRLILNFTHKHSIDHLMLFLSLDCEVRHEIGPNGMELVNVAQLQVCLGTKVLSENLSVVRRDPARLRQDLVLVEGQLAAHLVELGGLLAEHELEGFLLVGQ